MKGFFNTTHTNDSKFNLKLDKSPNGLNSLINEHTGKIDSLYLPTGLGGGLIFAGTFGENGIIISSEYAPELNLINISEIDLSKCVGFEFQYIGENPYILGNLELNKNDLIVCNGSGLPNWTLIDNSDKVVSVNGQTGAVTLDASDINAILSKYDESEQSPIRSTFIHTKNGIEYTKKVYDSGGIPEGSTLIIDGLEISCFNHDSISSTPARPTLNGEPVACLSDIENAIGNVSAILGNTEDLEV